jgi:hypothetical protein
VDIDTYFEMCELLGQEPDENNVPIDLNDLSYQTQLALEVYQYLGENWVEMAYLGKNINGISEIFDILGISNKYDKLLILQFIRVIDAYQSKKISEKIKAEAKRAN